MPAVVQYGLSLVFFFQAEEGIRDHCVTGVQTCALPIYGVSLPRRRRAPRRTQPDAVARRTGAADPAQRGEQIGRASCRERVENLGLGGTIAERKAALGVKVCTGNAGSGGERTGSVAGGS